MSLSTIELVAPDRVRPASAFRAALSRPAFALVVFVCLAILHTWPLAVNPAHLSRNDNDDTLLNTWSIAWVARQLPRDPRHLFDANIFYPERHTLGYSEAMIVQGVLAAPVIALGGSAVLAYNLVLLSGFALTGWAFWLLMRRWTGSSSAAYVSGCLAAFNSHVLVRLPHLQTQHVEFIAFALLALDRVIASAKTRDAVALGVAFALQALTSVYLLVFTTWLLLFAVAWRWREWLHRGRLRHASALALAAITAGVILAPYLLAYLEVHRLQGFIRSVDDGRRYAATWVNYLATGSRLHYALWSRPFFEEAVSCTFPGVAASALAALAFVWPESRRDRRFTMSVAAGLGCAVVSFAPHASFYPVLFQLIPLFSAVRVIAHLGQMVLLMIAVAAGFGVAGLLRRSKSDGVRFLVTALALVLVNGEALRAPLDYEPFSSIPQIYTTLASDAHAIIVELPMAPPVSFYSNGMYMLNSTVHWRPMLNGYSGFRPGSYDTMFAAVHDFPSIPSLLALKARGVTHVVLHTDSLASSVSSAAAKIGALELVNEADHIQIYRLR